jgi:ArsR family transcriptional regulator, virulence genes transcriptional regulator
MNTQLSLDRLRDYSQAMAARMRLLAHPERLLMLCRMSEGEVTVGELVDLTGLSQSAVSQHLARLRDTGVVQVRPHAQTRHYRLVDRDIHAIIAALCAICEAGEAGPAAPH